MKNQNNFNKTGLFFIRKIVFLFLITIIVLPLSGCNEQQNLMETSTSEVIYTFTEIPTTTYTITQTQEVLPTETPIEKTDPQPPANASPTPEPTFTFTPDLSATITLTPSITLSPTLTRFPSRTPIPTRTRWPSRTPTLTKTPTPPLAYFRINNIGPFSFVTSPIRPEAIVSPGEDGLIIVELTAEDGRIISKENINYSSYIGRRFGIAPEVNFELSRVSVYGRLSIYTKDRYGRLMALTSVDLLLMQLGSNKISSPKDLTEPFIIRQPKEDDVIKGGMMIVQGLARILSSSPIIIECLDPDGNIIGDARIDVEAPNQILSHIPFEAYIPYSIEQPTNVRFIVRQESSSRLAGTLYLYSFEITLEP